MQSENPQPAEVPVEDPKPEENIIRFPLLVDLPLPVLCYPVDQHIFEQKVLKPLEVDGLLGRSLQSLMKPAIVREEQKVIGETEKFFTKDMKVDGIYTKGAQEITYNLQKLEQRLLREKELGFFNRSNWEMRLDSDLTTHYLSRPVDISLETNPNTYLKHMSAMYSHRNNATKTKYYRLDLFLGQINFKDHPMFCEEDYLANQVIHQYHNYEKRVSLCLIDHLENRKKVLQDEFEEKSQLFRRGAFAASSLEQEKNNYLKEDLEVLQENLAESIKKIEEEKKFLQESADALYTKWLDLKALRAKQGVSHTTVKLAVKTVIENGRAPEYDFYLQSENPTDAVQPTEKSRRALISTTRVFIRILVNGVYVTRSTKQFLKWPTFEVFFGERFELHLFTRPVRVRLEICTGLRWTRTLAVVEFTPPGLNSRAMTSTGRLYKDLEFIGAEALKAVFADGVQRKVTGRVTLKASWVGHSEKLPPVRFDDLALVPRHVYVAPEDLALFIDINDPRNKDLINYIMQKRDEQIQGMLRNDALFPHYRFGCYRYMIYQERYNFNDLTEIPVPLLERDIIGNARMKSIIDMVKLRQPQAHRIHYFYVQELKNQSLKDTPGVIRMKQLMDSFRIKQNRIKLGFEKDKTSLENVVREFIMIDSKYLLQCWKFLFTPRRKLLPRKKKAPIVAVSSQSTCKISIIVYKAVNVPIRTGGIEKEKKYIQTEMINTIKTKYGISSYFSSQAPNMPYNSQPVWPNNSNPFGPQVNPPMVEEQRIEIDHDQIIKLGLIERVQSFVEIVLVHHDKTSLVRTIPFEGAFPEWNELLELTFACLNGSEFTINELLDCDSMLYFNLYDQLVSKADTIHHNEFNVKLERRFLAGFELPLLTVLQNPQGIEASFRLNRPLCLQGYRIERTDPFKANDSTDVFIDPEKPTYLSVKISLDPVLELPVDNEAEYYPGFEAPTFLFSGSNWLSTMKNKVSILKDRKIQLWAENTDGQSVFLPRYIHPLEPPQGLIAENDMDPIAKVARYVSLVPHIEDSQGFKDLPDIWNTSQEFFDLSFGDYEEHAVLLCNYFKWLDKEKPHIKSYVVIGSGVPEGKSIYVLRRDTVKGDLELWNSSTGVGYSIIQEPYSSSFLCFSISRGTKNRITDKEYTIGLKSVGCVFDDNDIYFNIQKYSDPYVIDFNIDNPKAWLPFLGPNRKPIFFPNNTINTVQKQIEYEITPERFIYEKQLELEDLLRKRFQSSKISSDNRGFRWASNEINNRIYELFPALETFYSSFRAGASESSLYVYQRERANQMLSEIEQQFLEVMGQKSFGITVNCPLEHPDKIWEKVKNTDVHNIGYDNCTFVLVARMFPYPGFVCSVWVYLGVIFGDHGYRTY